MDLFCIIVGHAVRHTCPGQAGPPPYDAIGDPLTRVYRAHTITDKFAIFTGCQGEKIPSHAPTNPQNFSPVIF